MSETKILRFQTDEERTEELGRKLLKAEPLVRNFCRKLCRGSDNLETDSEDLYQEVMVKAVRSAGKFRGGAKLSSWLCRVAITTRIDMRRALARQVSTVPLPAADKWMSKKTNKVPRTLVAFPTQEEIVNRQLIQVAMKNVVQRNAEMFADKILNFQSRAELAAKYGVSPRSVIQRLTRLRRKSRTNLASVGVTHYK